MLTRDMILASPLRLGSIDVPEWGGVVAIRALGIFEAVEVDDASGVAEQTVLAVLYGAAKEDGQRLFAADDKQWLTEQPWPLLLRVAKAVQEHTGAHAQMKDVLGN